jgi:hypothetical protein
MASILPAIVFANNNDDKDGWILTWSPMRNGDIGITPSQYQPLFCGYRDRSLQVEGTAGAGFNLAWEGSNDGVNYHALKDPFNEVLNLATVGVIAEILEACVFYRPHVTSGDGTTSVAVTAFYGKTKP